MKPRIPAELRGSMQSADGTFAVVVYEISESGFLLWSEKPFTPLDEATLTISLSGDIEVHFRLQIKHSRTSDYPLPETGFLAGASILEPSQPALSSLQQFITQNRYARFRRPRFR